MVKYVFAKDEIRVRFPVSAQKLIKIFLLNFVKNYLKDIPLLSPLSAAKTLKNQ